MVTDPILATGLVWLGALVNLAFTLRYVVATARSTAEPAEEAGDGVQPERVTWLIWAAAALIALGGQLMAGSPVTAWLLTAVLAVGPVAVVVASLGNRRLGWHVTRLNMACAVLGGAGLVALVVFSADPLWAVLLGVAVGAVAGVPTMANAYLHAERELYGPYLSLVFAAACVMATLAVPWSWVDAVYVLSLVLTNALTAMLLFTARRRLRVVAAPVAG